MYKKSVKLDVPAVLVVQELINGRASLVQQRKISFEPALNRCKRETVFCSDNLYSGEAGFFHGPFVRKRQTQHH